MDRGTEVSPDAHTAAAEFLEAVFSILSSLNSLPRALTRALEGYLDQRHLWEHFYNLAGAAMQEFFHALSYICLDFKRTQF